MNRSERLVAVLCSTVLLALAVWTWADALGPSEGEAKLAVLADIERGCQLLQVQGDELLRNCYRAQALLER